MTDAGNDETMAEWPLPPDPCPDWAQGSNEMFSNDIHDVVADRSRIDTLGAGEVLGFLEDQRALTRSVQTNELLLAARLADAYEAMPGVRAADNTDRDRPNRVVLAGEGAPSVHEHAPLELAMALGVGPDTGRVLMAHSLELRHRLPQLWARVETGQVDAWRARQVAAQTMSLALDVMDELDDLLAATSRAINRLTAIDLITEALLVVDPDEAARREAARSDGRAAFVIPPSPGEQQKFAEVHAYLDAPDAEALDAMLEQLAGILAELTPSGEDVEPLQHRRATALGILADPHAAAELLDTHRFQPTRSATLYVHAEFSDLSALFGDGPEAGVDRGARMERYGTATLHLVEQWLRRRDIKVTPVLDMTSTNAVDGHDPPQAMREQVILRDGTCQAPYCARSARSSDIDHIEPYVPPDDGGPPGQTTPANLQALCRRHHRLKTHAAKRYRALTSRAA